MLSPCIVVAEAVRLDVGRGVAVVDLDARLVRDRPACRLDLGAVLLAREEGRGPPELIAWRADVDGRPSHAAGPRGEVALDVPAHTQRVRVRAVLRGERFIAVPLSTDRLARGPNATFAAMASSVWGARSTAGVAQWIDLGTPVVVRVDPTRDHEPLTLFAPLGDGEPPAMIVDGGPLVGGAPTVTTPADRSAELARGGARALSILLTDLPLAIATAPDDASVIERLREASLAALAASSAKEPLLAVVGQRLTTALASGLRTCARDAELAPVPQRWPALLPALVGSGVLEDESAGCPRLAELLATNHPSVPIVRESLAALDEALLEAPESVPAIGALVRVAPPLDKPHPPRRARHRHVLRYGVAAVVALLLAAWIRWKYRPIDARRGG
jgi:hypothetical protein